MAWAFLECWEAAGPVVAVRVVQLEAKDGPGAMSPAAAAKLAETPWKALHLRGAVSSK